jgi:hypothetical protein
METVQRGCNERWQVIFTQVKAAPPAQADETPRAALQRWLVDEHGLIVPTTIPRVRVRAAPRHATKPQDHQPACPTCSATGEIEVTVSAELQCRCGHRWRVPDLAEIISTGELDPLR